MRTMASGDENQNLAAPALQIGYAREGAVRVEDRTIDMQRIAALRDASPRSAIERDDLIEAAEDRPSPDVSHRKGRRHEARDLVAPQIERERLEHA